MEVVEGLTWTMHDITGGFHGVLRGRTVGSRVSIDTHQHSGGTLRLSLDDPLAGSVYPLRTIIRAWLDGSPVLAGPVGVPVFRGGDQTVEVPILGPTHRLRNPLGQRADGAGIPGHVPGLPLRVEQVAEGEIMWAIVEHLRPTPAELDAGIPDLGIVRGNIAPGQLRDREFEAGKEGFETLVQLAEVLEGQDFMFRCVDDKARPEVLAALDVFDEIGYDRSRQVILEYAAGANTAADLTYSPGASSGLPVLNRMTGVGDAPEAVEGEAAPPVPPVYTANQFESQQAFGIWGAHVGLTGISDVLTVADRVGEVVSTQAFPVDHFEVVPAMQDGSALLVGDDGRRRRVPGFGRPPRFGPAGEWWVGDLIRTRGLLGRIPVDLVGEVLGCDLEEADEAGNVQVKVRLAPSVKAALAV